MQNLNEDQRNLNFIQISPETFEHFNELVRKNALSAQILFFLIQHMAYHNNAVSVSYTALQEILGYGRTTLTKAIKILEKDNYIQIVKQGTSNIYVINERVAWRKARNQRQYAIFSATVVATSTENKKALDQLKYGKNKLKSVPRIDIKPNLNSLLIDEN